MELVLLLIFIGIVHCSVIPHQLTEYDLPVQLAPLEIENFKVLASEEPKIMMPEMITAEGYPAENHFVTTPDGYILNIHRIPRGKTGLNNKKVVFLQHGILVSSSDWVIQGSGKALGYLLADEGYDVWMGNVRGNTYSRNHTTLDPDTDSDFWQFSWHEIGYTDLPTMIDYVLKQTGADGIYYAGHSQGTTTFYVMTSTRPEYNAKIKAHVSLAPIGYMDHMTSPLLKNISAWEVPLSVLADLLGVNEFLPSQGFFNVIAGDLCTPGLGAILCENALFAICGFSPEHMNLTLMPAIVAHAPAGAATKQLLHYAQEINSGKFRQYDWGFLSNLVKYGSLEPPEYNLAEITTPVYMIYSHNDWLAGEVDVERLCAELGNCVDKFKVTDDTFNHLDFTYGIDAPSLVYSRVLSLFAKH